MRIVASACLVLAILFMVGCGTSAEDKTAIKTNTDNIAALQKSVSDMTANVQKMTTDLGNVETFLKDKTAKFGMYGMPPDTTKKLTQQPKPAPAPKTPAANKPPANPPTKTK